MLLCPHSPSPPGTINLFFVSRCFCLVSFAHLVWCVSFNFNAEVVFAKVLLANFPGSSVGEEFPSNAGDPGLIRGSGRSAGEGIGYPPSVLGQSLWLSWWRICLQCGRPRFDPWVGKMLWRRERLPTPVFWPGEFRGLCSAWGHKESDTTEGLHFTFTLAKAHHMTKSKVKGLRNTHYLP